MSIYILLRTGYNIHFPNQYNDKISTCVQGYGQVRFDLPDLI